MRRGFEREKERERAAAAADSILYRIVVDIEFDLEPVCWLALSFSAAALLLFDCWLSNRTLFKASALDL